jgi:hypothetical protein
MRVSAALRLAIDANVSEIKATPINILNSNQPEGSA